MLHSERPAPFAQRVPFADLPSHHLCHRAIISFALAATFAMSCSASEEASTDAASSVTSAASSAVTAATSAVLDSFKVAKQ